LKVKATRARPKIEVTADGRGIVSHAGLRLPAEVADSLGLTEALGNATAATRQRRSGHDPGKVLVDVALSLTDGGRRLSDLAVVRNQPGIFGSVASTPTA
jgi:Transposase DDE domain group 1